MNGIAFNLGLGILALALLAGCRKPPQDQSAHTEKDAAYASSEAPQGIGEGAPKGYDLPPSKIRRGACRILAEVTLLEKEYAHVMVKEVKGYGPNYSYGFPLEGNMLKVIGADTSDWEMGSAMLLEVQPVFEGYRDEDMKVVKYVKTVE